LARIRQCDGTAKIGSKILESIVTIDMEKLRQEIEFDEGCKLGVYLCSEGHRTVGIGHLIRETDEENKLQIGDAITPERCESLFTHDVAIACRDCSEIFRNFNQLPGDVKRVIINMAFQLGRPRLAQFKKFRAAIEEKDYVTAGAEMLDSLWAKQTPNRVKRLHQRMLAAVDVTLTESQRRVYQAISAHWKKHSLPPSMADIADELDIFVNAVSETVTRLENKGFLVPREGHARSLMPIDLRDHVRKFYSES
jgi:GH24 family phage-related lysozyme (muramidase)/biotin operon repressor